MSFQRKVIILGSVFLILLAALVLGTVFSPQGTASRQSEALLFPALKPSQARRIEIGDASSKVSLVLSGDWTIDVAGKMYPASQERVNGLLQELAAITRGTVVTRDAKAAESLGLSEKEAKRLVLFGAKDERLCDLSIGRFAAGGQGIYLRVGDRSEVLRTGEGLSRYLGIERRDWANLRVLPPGLKADTIMRLTVTNSRALPETKGARPFQYTLVKETDTRGGSVWSLAGEKGRKLDAKKIDGMANALAGLEGSDFLTDGAPSAVLSPQAAEVTVSLTDNRTFTIRFGLKKEKNQYPCGLAEGAYAYLVPEWRVNEILAAPETLTLAAR
jgi:hypothetical protein